MRIKKSELEQMREVENEEYASRDDYLQAMFETVVMLLQERSAWAVGIKFTPGSPVRAYGPFYNKGTAGKAGRTYASVLGSEGGPPVAFLNELNPPSKLNKEKSIV